MVCVILLLVCSMCVCQECVPSLESKGVGDLLFVLDTAGRAKKQAYSFHSNNGDFIFKDLRFSQQSRDCASANNLADP